jgi:septal ring factor EnvC (AmiA/AmiB activator)
MEPRTSHPEIPVVVDGNSRTTLAVMVGVVVAICGVVSTAAVAQFRISEIEKSATELGKASNEHEKRIQRIEDQFAHIARSLEKIEAKFDALASKKP